MSIRFNEPSASSDVEINYVHKGSLKYFLAGRFVTLTPRRLAVFWAALPNRILEQAPTTSFVRLNVPLMTLLRWNLGGGFMQPLLSGALVVDRESPAWDADQIARWSADLATGDALIAGTVELELEARLRRLARNQRRKTASFASDDRRHTQVQTIASYLTQHFREDITAQEVAAAVRLQPNHVMSLFRRECGMSLWQYLTRLRLSHAQLALLESDSTVLSLALESGFGSLARFYAAFSKECGMAPGEYRRRGGLLYGNTVGHDPGTLPVGAGRGSEAAALG